MRTWKLPADVDTDQLAPGHAMKHGLDVIARHCLERVRPEFATQVQTRRRHRRRPQLRHRLVARTGRERAGAARHRRGDRAELLRACIHRNAFNVGLLLLTCPEADRIGDGEAIAFDARAGRVQRANGDVLACKPISALLLDLVEAGGLLNQLKRQRNTSP